MGTPVHNLPESVVSAQTRDTSKGSRAGGCPGRPPPRPAGLDTSTWAEQRAGPSLDWSPSSKGTNGSSGVRPHQEVVSGARAGLGHSRLSHVQLLPIKDDPALTEWAWIYSFHKYLPGTVRYRFSESRRLATVPGYLFSQTLFWMCLDGPTPLSAPLKR